METEKTCVKEAVFSREKIAAKMAVSERCLTDLKLNIGKTHEDYVLDRLTASLSGHIYSNTIDERKLEYYSEPPTFLDWLFRRRKLIIFDFKAKDLLLDPPSDGCLRTYEVTHGKLR